MKTIDIKSLLIGLLLGLCFVLAALALSTWQVGQYQIRNLDSRSVFRVNTATGELTAWHYSNYTKQYEPVAVEPQ